MRPTDRQPRKSAEHASKSAFTIGKRKNAYTYNAQAAKASGRRRSCNVAEPVTSPGPVRGYRAEENEKENKKMKIYNDIYELNAAAEEAGEPEFFDRDELDRTLTATEILEEIRCGAKINAWNDVFQYNDEGDLVGYTWEDASMLVNGML